MPPALFGVPSILYTRIGQLSFLIKRLFHLTKFKFINRSLAPQMRSAFNESTLPVSVVCIEMSSLNDFELGVKTTM
jgi:hypothetical protein